MPEGQVYVLGEVHDNPAHHEMQGALIAQIAPTAVVFEMLTGEQADRLDLDTPRDPQILEQVLGWSEMGWPDIAIYLPVFEAIEVPILGGGGAPGDLSAFGLDMPLPDAEQAAREALQLAAHCDALPVNLLPRFVTRQRELDAQLAARTLEALDRYGAPVVLIAGNGHARADWGVPAAIARVRSDLEVVAVVQGEGGAIPPGGDVALTAPAPEGRADPCDAFR
ncbi:ChaN family lipoprotein [Jannaschia sp.]|nr:ChaN family lipoprotein [Jannaschia sp.]